MQSLYVVPCYHPPPPNPYQDSKEGRETSADSKPDQPLLVRQMGQLLLHLESGIDNIALVSQ